MSAPGWVVEAVKDGLRRDVRAEVASRWSAHRCERLHDSFTTCARCVAWACAQVARMSDPLAEAASVIAAWSALSPSADHLDASSLVLIVQDGSGYELVWPMASRGALALQPLMTTWAAQFAGQVVVHALGDEFVCLRPHTFFAKWPEA